VQPPAPVVLPATNATPATEIRALPAPAADPNANRGPLTIENELPAAIQFLARLANVNIHFDPSITFTNLPGAVTPDGRPAVPVISLRWDNVTPEDALDEVLDIHGLMLVRNPKTNIGRVTKKPTLSPLFTTTVQLKYSNPTNMAELIRTTFTDTNRSRVNPDSRTSQLVIVSTEKELESATNLLAQLDTPTKQVLIEARLLETAKNPRSIKGIDWSGTLEAQNLFFGNGRTTGTTTTRTPGDPTTTTLPSGRTVTTAPGISTATELVTQIGAGGLSLDSARGLHPSTAFLNADGVRAVLSFLNSDSDTEVVATPRQVTADNQLATLSVTRAYPIFEITPGSAQTPPTARITYTNLGTILKVTPRIAAKSNVFLRVVPEVSNIDSKDRQIINGDVNEANVYAIRRMETEVLIPSGNTLVMGGLISDTTSKASTKVPFLGDLPGIGAAFRHESKEHRKSNLIIFITPTIVQATDFQPMSTDFLQTQPRLDPQDTAAERTRPLTQKSK
jgi:type IV pilus assembly protein PilQ